MGCCGSKEKKPKETAGRPEAVSQKALAAPVQAPKEEMKVVAETPQKAEEPLSVARIKKLLKAKESDYRYGRCTAEGKKTSFFPPHGLCYLIEDGDTWFFYNDTLNYEMHVSYLFSPDADVTPLDRTAKKMEEDGSSVLSVVVYPLETVKFASGEKGVYKAGVSAEPLSNEYRETLQIITQTAANEIRRVLHLTPRSVDEEVTLQRCVETNTPYVDLNFEPSLKMLCRPDVDARVIEPTEIRRAALCHGVNADEVAAIRGPVIPQCIDSGLLYDTWLTSALAVLAEDERRVREIFALCSPEEMKLGAYRLSINKNGWWKPVIVDDFLPTVNNTPCFARTLDDPSELWVSLLQKLYAKLHGSYASITGGDAALALRDFTGAPSYRFDEEWANACKEGENSDELLAKVMHYLEAGNTVLLTTPAGANAKKTANTGLRDGYTYYLKAVCHIPNSGHVMLKIHNPWELTNPWTGEWCEGSKNWDKYDEVRRMCNPDFSLKDGSFWMEWSDAAQYFDGCSVVFTSQSPVYDYRVLAEFSYVQPNVMFMVRAAEPVEVMLTLTQKDKRGVPIDKPDAKHSPIMINVSRGDGNKQRVDKSSTSNPEEPSDAFTFVVSREVAMTYTFEPSEEPYFVIPRIHRKGTSAGQKKDFVLGIRSLTPLEGKLDVQLTHIDANSPVLRNRVSFVVEETPEVILPLQKKMPGEAVETGAGSKLSTATIPEKQPAVAEEEKEEEGEEEEEQKEAVALKEDASEHELGLPLEEEEDIMKKTKMNGGADGNGAEDHIIFKENGHIE